MIKRAVLATVCLFGTIAGLYLPNNSPFTNPNATVQACGSKLNDILELTCEGRFNSVFVGKEEDGTLHRSKRGIVEECCDKPCTLRHLGTYCESDPKYGPMFQQNDLRTESPSTQPTPRKKNIMENKVRRKGGKARRDRENLEWADDVKPVFMQCLYPSPTNFLLKGKRRRKGQRKGKITKVATRRNNTGWGHVTSAPIRQCADCNNYWNLKLPHS